MRRKWRMEIYESPDRKFRWRMRSANGLVVADGSEGYFSRANATRAVREIKRRMFCCEVTHITGVTEGLK